jgi:cation-transporting P-type ATPase 13A2
MVSNKSWTKVPTKVPLLMEKTVPFVVIIVVTLLISLYMLLDPAKWLSNFMELTEMSLDFKFTLLALAATGFAVAYVAERHFFPLMAKYIGRLKGMLRPSHQKKRKMYKKILAEMED